MNANAKFDAPADEMGDKRELRGRLLLFVAWLGVIGPIYSVGLNGYFAFRWQAMYPEAAGYYASWAFWWFVAAREASRVVAAIVMVARRTREAIWFAIVTLWLSGPGLVTGAWLLSGKAIVMPGALIRSGAIAAAATLYLLRSKQVRTVYGVEAPTLDAATSVMEREQPSS